MARRRESAASTISTGFGLCADVQRYVVFFGLRDYDRQACISILVIERVVLQNYEPPRDLQMSSS